MKQFPWIALACALLYILWVQTCTNRKSVKPGIVEHIQTVIKKDVSATKVIDSLKEQNVYQASVIVQTDEERAEVERKLKIANNNVTALTNDLADARVTKDTLRYVIDCDSLELSARNQQRLFERQKRKTDSAIAARDFLIRDQKTIIDTSEASRIRLVQALIEAKNGLPKSSLYAGITAVGTRSDPLSGIGPSVSLVTKNGYEYTAGFLFLKNGNNIYQVGLKKKIFIH